MTLSALAAADDAPTGDALVAGGAALTHEALAARVAAAAAHLLDAGVVDGPRAPVALVGETTVASIVVLHALVHLGVPVVLVHPRLTERERADLVADAAPRAVLAAPAVAAAAAARPPARALPPPPPDDERALAILYTSGTTGRSKGALLSRRAFAAAAAASAARLGWRDDDRWLLALPLAHVGGLSVLLRCLLARRAVVLGGSTPDDVIAAVERDRATLVSLVPTQLQRLLARTPSWDPPAHLRAILVGGAAAAPALLGRAADRGWPVLTTYGLTEACSQVATQRPGTVNRGDLGAGPPLPGTEVRIAPDGTILVRGPTLFSGYLHHPSPLDADGWLATGDLGRLDELGHLHVLARRADLVVSGGENVYPAEVEGVLAQHPAVAAACVFGVPDEEWGQVVAAALVPAPGEPPPDDAALRAWWSGRLAGFKRPRRLAWLPSLPTNAAGKVDRAAVARAAATLLRAVG